MACRACGQRLAASVDAIEAPNGFVYSVYFDGLVGEMHAPLIRVNASDCSNLPFDSDAGESVGGPVLDVQAAAARVSRAPRLRKVEQAFRSRSRVQSRGAPRPRRHDHPA